MEFEVVVGTYDCFVKAYSVDILSPEEKGLRLKYTARDHVGCVRAVASGGPYLATGGTDDTIRLYDMRRHTEIGSLLQHQGSITCLAFHQGTHLLSASEDGTICVWKTGSWECVHSINAHKHGVTCLSVHPSGKMALSTGKDRTAKTWNLLTGHVAFTQRLHKGAELVSWSAVGDQYALCCDKCVSLYSVESTTAATVIDVGAHVNCILFLKEGVLAVGSDKSAIELFSTSSGELLSSLEGHSSRVKGLSLSPLGDILFSVSSNGSVKCWNISDVEAPQCVSSADSDSRLTCVALVTPTSLLKELRETETTEGTTQTAAADGEGQTVPVEPKKKRKSKKKEKSKPLAAKSSDSISVCQNKGKVKISKSSAKNIRRRKRNLFATS